MLHRKAGWRFSYLRLKSMATMRKVLSLIPYRFEEGTALFHSWIPSFDPHRPIGLAIMVWISLRLLPLEFLDYACTIASFVGRLIEEDPRVTVTQDPHFCVKLDLEKGWISTLELLGFDGRTTEVIIEYNNETIRCSHCFHLDHLTDNCGLQTLSEPEPFLVSRNPRESRKPRKASGPPKIYPQVRAELENDGFTIVEPCKQCRTQPQASY